MDMPVDKVFTGVHKSIDKGFSMILTHAPKGGSRGDPMYVALKGGPLQGRYVAVLCHVGALYDEGDIMVVVTATAHEEPVLAWVRREDITIQEQSPNGTRLRGRVKARLLEARGSALRVAVGQAGGTKDFWVAEEAVMPTY